MTLKGGNARMSFELAFKIVRERFKKKEKKGKTSGGR